MKHSVSGKNFRKNRHNQTAEKTYRFAHPVQTYLFIGTDKSGNEDASGEEYRGSMADALMLVVVDEEEKPMEFYS